METKSPPPCPNTVTVRRNPPRRARPTPFSAAPLSLPPSSKTSSAIRSFPIHDILSIDIPDKHEISVPSSSNKPSDSDKLKVFVRVRPVITGPKSVKNGAQKNVWPQNPSRKKEASKTAKAAGKKNGEICVKVNDSHSLTLSPPQSLADVRRTKSEVYEGFSHVFCAESTQNEVYERMVNPIVVDLLKGKSGMLAAMGPSGSGKTHTVFGSNRDPGMVSLALRQIFSENESSRYKTFRTFYLSMFEIYSEGGKGEKIMDLSQEGGDLSMQQSNIKGLQEVVIRDVHEAESLIATGMLKRSTAMTNSNIQSSRSQCIINIRCNNDDLKEAQSKTAMLTIVDLAGAEREKRTGNQGARFLESNFINNTSMVFGLCLRSLLEHQKNPKKPFHKHFQNSMLTKYLRDYLEGKKKMALILTVKPGEEDYQDTSYLLRQASPFMNIKFENVEEQTANTFGNKRRTQTIPKEEQSKRLKLNNNEVCMDDGVNGGILHQPHKEVLKVVSTELIPEEDKDVKTNDSSSECPATIYREPNKNKSIKENITDSAKKVREHQILLNFSRALWKVLKEYKTKLEASENEVNSLKHSLFVEKERCVALETELNLMKISCSFRKDEVAKVPVVEKNTIQETSSVTLFSDCSDMNNLEKQVPCEYVLFDKDDFVELGDTEFDNEISDCDTLHSVVSDSELLVHGDEVSTFMKRDQRTHEEEEKVDISSPNVVSDKQESGEAEERVTIGEMTGCDNLISAISNSELLMDGEDFSSSVKGDQQQHEEEDSNPQVSSSNQSKLELFEKQDILNDTGPSFVELESISSDFEKFEDQSNKKVDILSPSIVSDKQEFKEVEEKETHGETTVDQDSEFPCVIGDDISSTLNDDQLEHEEKGVNILNFSSDLEGSICVGKTEFIHSTVVSDQQLVPPEDSITSQERTASKLPEAPSVQTCQPSSASAVKPKRRLRPASSLMLRNISISDFDDATEKPKRHGKRGENEDCSQKTQGSITLLRILQQNHHR